MEDIPCLHDIISPRISNEQAKQFFWDNLLRLEKQPQDYVREALLPHFELVQHWLFHGVPDAWMTEFLDLGPVEGSEYDDIPIHRELLGRAQNLGFLDDGRRLQCANMSVRNINVPRSFPAQLQGDRLVQVFDGYLLMELYSAPINVSMSQRILERTACAFRTSASLIDENSK